MKSNKKDKLNNDLHTKIMDIIIESNLLVKQENWDFEGVKIRAIYDSYRIINLIYKNNE